MQSWRIWVCLGLGVGASGTSCTDEPHEPARLATTSAALNLSPDVGDFGILATRSVALRGKATVTGGDVGVGPSAGPYLGGTHSLLVQKQAKVNSPANVLAPSVRLEANAVVADVQTNTLAAQGATYGVLAPYLAPPALPALGAVTPGSTNLNVPSGQVVVVNGSASHAAVSVATGGTLRLGTGLYQFGSLTLGSQARLEVLGAAEVRLAQRLGADSLSYLGPATGVQLTANELRVEVGGINGTTGGLGENPKAASFGTGSQVQALVLAPNGTIFINTEATIKGTLAGREVDVGGKTNVTFEDGFPIPCSPPNCDDANPCTTDSCTQGGCVHQNVAAGTSCADANVCNGGETCDGAGSCQPGTPLVLDDDNACTTDSCHPVSGVSHVPVAAGTPCLDGNVCNGGESCDGNATCQPGTPLVTDDGNACTTDGCHPVTGVSHTPVAAGAPCPDATVCNGAETCDAAGSCQPGAPLVVDDGNACTSDSCDPASGVSHVPVAQGTPCPDGNVCNGAEACDAAAVCQAGTALPTDDGNPCTDDLCDPIAGVTHPASASGTACADADMCDGSEECDGQGSCVAGDPAAIDDGDPCTIDTCDPATGITHSPCSALDLTVATTLGAATEFLYTGSDPIQTGVAPGTIDPLVVAIVQGVVRDASGSPLVGVSVRVFGHDELGQTVTQGNGSFQLAANGGGQLTIAFEKDGYLPAHRHVDTVWQDWANVGELRLLPRDAAVTEIDLGSPQPFQVAQGSPITDADGTRQATVLFAAGTQAEAVLEDGSTVPLTTLNIRATEYTVGPGGPESMPAPLPPTSGYTYAVELSADEADALGAVRLDLNPPLPVYVDNFLGFPAGEIVPAGFYDRTSAVWVPSDNGRVIAIVGEAAGVAQVDADGDGNEDSPAELLALGITDAERVQLATLYDTGKTLWRVPIGHFTPWDFNWPYGPDDDDCAPGSPDCPIPDPHVDDPDDDSCEESGSIIECQNQTLGERLSIAGTNYTLNYRSDRVRGRKDEIRVPITGPNVPSSLLSITARVSVAGQTLEQQFVCPCPPNTTHAFFWDGTDAFGRVVQGEQPAKVELGYTYIPVYYPARSDFLRAWAEFTNTPSSATPARDRFTLWKMWTLQVGVWDALAHGLGGWSVDVHHFYDVVGRRLYRGDGSQVTAHAIDPVVRTFAGGGTSSADNIPASQARFLGTTGNHAIGPDGSVYVVESARVRRILPNGIVTTVAGNGSIGSSGDGGPAILAQTQPHDVALGPDGSLYIVELSQAKVRRVAPNGVITTLAGTGTAGFSGDGGPASAAQLNLPVGVAVGPDGSVYISDSVNRRIRRVDVSGVITTVAGSAGFCHELAATTPCGDGGLATEATLNGPAGIAVSNDGTIYFADHFVNRIRKITPDGFISRAAGDGQTIHAGDGLPAEQASMYRPQDVAIGPDGSLYIAARYNHRVRRVSGSGIITTIAGTGEFGADPPISGSALGAGENGPATAAQIGDPLAVAVFADGRVTAFSKGRLVEFHPPLPGLSPGQLIFPSEDAREYYVFDPSGRHLETRNALTNSPRFAFAYDSAGRLVTITDGDSNVTTIQRDTAGNPTAILGPYGHVTPVTLDSNGYLATVTNPASEQHVMTYSPDGLMGTFKDPRNGLSIFSYDPLGRLIFDDDPADGSWDVVRTELPGGHRVTLMSAMGRATEHDIERLPNGVEERTTTFPSGLSAVQQIGTNSTTTTTLPDGTVTVVAKSGDQRFSMLAPTRSVTVSTPGGKTRVSKTTRAVTLSDPSNVLSMTAMTETTTVNGKASTRTWNAGPRTLTTKSPLLRETVTTLDPQGRVSHVALPGVTPWQFTYDAQGRLQSTTQGNRATIRTYDTQGNLETLTDALLQLTSFDHDAIGRVTAQIRPDDEVIGFGYDDNANLTTVTPPDQPSHGMSYTPVNLLESYDPPVLQSGATPTLWDYNSDRQVDLVTRPDAGLVDYEYDSAGRLSTVAFPGGTVTRSYSATTGKLQTIAGPDGATITYGYDGRLVTSTAWSGIVTGQVGRGYDNDFRLVTETINGGDAVAFEYDDDGLLTNAAGLSITRDSQTARVAATSLGNITESFAYNAFGELSDYHAKYNGFTLLHAVYVRDDLGRISEKTETVDGVTAIYKYFYDDAGRLESAEKDAVQVAAYTYDANGNRLTKWTPSAGTLSATYDEQDRILTFATKSYTHTSAGELQSVADSAAATTTQYSYDALGSLRAVILGDGTEVEYSVDGASHRILKKVNGIVVKRWLWRGQLQPVAELDASGSLVARYIYMSGTNVPEVMVKSGATYRFVKDHLGSVRKVVDVSTGSVAQKIDYDEFGRKVADTNPGFQPFGFAGGLHDEHTGITRFGIRDYDATTGRWISKDPIHFAGGSANLYEYVSNDPVNRRDPMGLLDPGTLVRTGVGAAAAAAAAPAMGIVGLCVLASVLLESDAASEEVTLCKGGCDEFVPDESGTYERCILLADDPYTNSCSYYCESDNSVEVIPKAIPMKPGDPYGDCDEYFYRLVD